MKSQAQSLHKPILLSSIQASTFLTTFTVILKLVTVINFAYQQSTALRGLQKERLCGKEKASLSENVDEAIFKEELKKEQVCMLTARTS